MPSGWKLSRRLVVSYAISTCVWLSIGLLSVVQQYVNNASSRIDLVHLQSVAAFFLAIAILTPLVFYLGRRFPVTRKAVVHPALIYLIGIPLFAITFGLVRSMIAPLWSDWAAHYSFLEISTIWSFTYRNFANLTWMYLEILLTANAQAYFERARSEALERAELEQALAASELQLLKAQLHPHFIFNTLHGIATLAKEDGDRASEMVLQLASLLRAAMEHRTSELIPLSEELRFIEAYLKLEKMRLDRRLAVRWSILPILKKAQVPHLILQPLIENSIIHGVAASRTEGFIEIEGKQDRDQLVLRVSNSVGPLAHTGTGFGLRNTESRLRYLYGRDAKLEFDLDEQRHIARATLWLPLLLSTSSKNEDEQPGGLISNVARIDH